MKRYLILTLMLCLLAGCGEPSPTPDTVATQVAQAQAVAATLTAAVPTPTETPAASPTPTMTETPVPTVTPIPSETPVPLLQGVPLDYIPTESEMPDGFSMIEKRAVTTGDESLPGWVVMYHEDLAAPLFLMVAFTVIVAPDEDTAQLRWEAYTEDIRDESLVEVNVFGADEHVSYLDEEVVTTFIRYRNVVGSVMLAPDPFVSRGDSEFYVALLLEKLRD